MDIFKTVFPSVYHVSLELWVCWKYGQHKNSLPQCRQGTEEGEMGAVSAATTVSSPGTGEAWWGWSELSRHRGSMVGLE